MREFLGSYLDDKIKLDRWQRISIICLVIVISGIFGWLYEFIFYYFNSGMKNFYMRGANFLPWINIYAYGAIIIIILSYKCKKKPWLVFLLAFFSTGILEYFSGYFMLKFTGMRCWNYNTEILNFGNINGFVCLRSVTFFGISGLFLIYVIIPFLMWLSSKIDKRRFLIFSVIICSIFLIDELYNLLFHYMFNMPKASSIYKGFGIKYMNYFK